MARLKLQKGFTLVELLLYISLAAGILLTTSVFLAELLQARIKNQTVAEVELQGLQAMQLMTQAIRNAEAITLPDQGGDASSLILDIVDVANDPTEFDTANGTLRITEGGDVVPLTNARVVASELTFENLSRQDTPGTVRISFMLSHVNPENRNEYSYEKTFVGSATLRQP